MRLAYLQKQGFKDDVQQRWILTNTGSETHTEKFPTVSRNFTGSYLLEGQQQPTCPRSFGLRAHTDRATPARSRAAPFPPSPRLQRDAPGCHVFVCAGLHSLNGTDFLSTTAHIKSY